MQTRRHGWQHLCAEKEWMILNGIVEEIDISKHFVTRGKRYWWKYHGKHYQYTDKWRIILQEQDPKGMERYDDKRKDIAKKGLH